MAEKGLKDSGQRREFATGAVRDAVDGKGAFHLLGIHGIVKYAQQLQKGAAKYDSRNWEKGQPLSCYADSAIRHILKALAGYDDEDHLAGAAWNLLNWIEGAERIRQGIWPAELDDLPKTFQGKEPPF